MEQTISGAQQERLIKASESGSVEQAIEIAGEEELLRYRKLGKGGTALMLAVSLGSTLLAINQIFNLGFFIDYVIIENQYLYVLAAMLLPMVFVVFPANSRSTNRVPWYDAALAAITFLLVCYYVWNADRILEEAWEYSAPVSSVVVSLALWAILIEVSRRTGGQTIMWIVLVSSLFPLYAHLMPAALSGIRQDLWTTAAFHMMSIESFLGAPMQAFALLVFGFLVFGVAMQYTGAGAFFINIAFALLGTVRGGPAKVAIFSSALFGSMSGSVVSNVLPTGCMTIPAMKKAGFRSSYAAGIEACASTGGVLMPPVMGATAFVMASFLNVPYAEVALAAALPSILYYFGLFMQIDAYAAKHGLVGIPEVEVLKLWPTIKEGWYYCVSFGGLIWMLLVLQQEQAAPFYATAILLVINQFSGKHRMGIAELKKFIYGCGLLFIELIGVLGPIGLLIGGLTVTGMIGTLTNDLVFPAGGSTILLLIMGAVTSFILGLGLTTTACYIFLAVILAPALIKNGLDPMAVHMFLLYWGMISFITPPVAIAAVAAAGLARSPQWETGMQAMKLGAVIYFVPFFFVYNPALLLKGPAGEILAVAIAAIIGVVLISAAIQDYLIGFGVLGSGVLALVGRFLVFVGGVFMAAPGGTFGMNHLRLFAVSLAAGLPGLALCWLDRRVRRPRPVPLATA